ncbi:MAG: hypothetical protein FJ088_15295, partial [Deltaproteobacteria bacterium]|nr:hypothetical protein [Deltaproteobacteria bacterium]
GEFQGYFLEVLLERYPEVVEKMRTLAERGQVEFMSFHYSDQLFLAFSRRSMEVSYELTKEAYDKACLPLSPVVFTQEGQYGEGMMPFMLEHGYKTLVLPKNLYKYFHGEDDPVAPFYELRGGEVVISRGFSNGEVEVAWHFVDDGELLLTNGADPYLGMFFAYKEESKNKFIKEMQDFEASGFWVTTISEYMKRLGETETKPGELKPTPDGTWQAGNSDNFYAWMGRAGLWGETERDNEVLTGNFRAEALLKAAENCVAEGVKQGKIESNEFGDDLKSAWRELMFAQVSDATGWNPWAGEVNYSLTHNKNAVDKAEQILFACRESFDEDILAVEARMGGIVVPCTVLQTLVSVIPDEVEPPIAVAIDKGGFDVDEKWYSMGEGVTGGKSYIARFKF